MAITVVLDHPRAHVGRRLVMLLRGAAGSLLVLLGLVASIVAIPASVAVAGLAVGWVSGEGTAAEPWPPPDFPVFWTVAAWGVSLSITVVGLRTGLRLMRGHRKLVLFLRRFGHDDATLAATFATSRTIGTSWRLVTLDDDEIAPVGLTATARGAFGGVTFLVTWIMRLGRLPLRVFPVVITAMWGVVGLQLLVTDRWMEALEPYVQVFVSIMEFRLPFDRVALDLPGVFAALAIVAAVAGVGMFVMVVALLSAFPLMLPLFFFSSSVESAQRAEQAKTSSISRPAEIPSVAAEIATRNRRVFAPRLIVLRVASTIWQSTVEQLGRVVSVVLIDVSEPTGNLIWEVETLVPRFGARCILIGHHNRALRLSEVGDAGEGPYERRLAELLDGHEVLAYTTDRGGMRRFARALRARLLSLPD